MVFWLSFLKDHGVNNYCCGGGSGFAIMQSMSFPQWRNNIAHRKKLEHLKTPFSQKERMVFWLSFLPI